MTSTQTEPQTEPQYRVLLIGIDDYRKKPLSGCVNDIDGVQRFLLDNVRIPTNRIRRLASPRAASNPSTAVPDRAATLDNIRDELSQLARDAQAGEKVFIYYSGHGARAGFERPDGRTFHRESLVPVDVDSATDRRLLADYELNGFLGKIAARTPSVTVVLDCCHSAGATRDPGLPELRARGLDLRQDLGWMRPLRTQDTIEVPSPRTRSGQTRGGDEAAERTVDDCQVVAACLDHELAAEGANSDSVFHGLLTDAFLRALRDIPRDQLRSVAWRRIWQAIRAAVKARNPWQNVWMTGNPGRAVFAGPPIDGDVGLSLRRNGDVYEIDAGTLASVTTGTRIAVYGEQPLFFPPLASRADEAERSGLLRVTRADESTATATAEGAPFVLPFGARGRIIEVGEPAKLKCAILPKNDRLVSALNSPLITIVDKKDAQVRLEEVGGVWLITDDKHAETAETALVVLKPDDLDHVRAVLEHYYHYALPLRMAESAKDLPGALELQVLQCDHDLSSEAAQEADLPRAAPTVSSGTRVCFRVRNTSKVELRVTLLNSAASGRVQILGDQAIVPSGGHVFWAGGTIGKPFMLTLPPGKRQGIDRLTAIGTTALSKDLSYLRVTRRFADILAITRGEVRDTAKDLDGDDDARNNPPPEQWTAASAILTTVAS